MSGPVKVVISMRRKSDMTRQEFFDSRYQIHGSITDALDSPADKPNKHINNHVYDSAYGLRADGPPNSVPHFFGRDDVAELFFDDMDHLMTVLQSEHVRKVVGPDVALTNDFETATAVLAIERSIVLEGQGRSEVDNNLVAWYWVSTKNVDIDGTGFEAEATPVLVDLLKNHARSEVSQVLVNTGITSPRVDVTKIFGGGQMPRYGVIYKMVMKTPASARAVRKVQALFAERFEGQLDAGNSYILFAKETLIASVAGDHRYDARRQPVFTDLGEPLDVGYYDAKQGKVVTPGSS